MTPEGLCASAWARVAMGRERRASDGAAVEDGGADGWAHEAAAAEPPRRVTRTILAAVLLFTTGSLMLYFGALALPTERDRGLAMIVTGAIAFIPGAYASAVIVGTLLGWPGWDYHDLPSYDAD